MKTSAVEGDDKGPRHRLYYASFWAPHQRLQSEMETGSTLLQPGSSCDCQSCLPMIGHRSQTQGTTQLTVTHCTDTSELTQNDVTQQGLLC